MHAVVLRELRAEAQRPLTLWLRMGSAALFFALLEIALQDRGTVDATCRDLFPLLHQLLLVVSLLVGPVLVVDDLARERRERTLELLLLTPLPASSVLHGKNVVLAARTAVLVVATLPVVTFTLLLGGVSREEWLVLVLVHAMGLAVSLAAGWLAASWRTTWAGAMALAVALLLAGSTAVACGIFAFFQPLIGTYAPELWPTPATEGEWLAGALRLVADVDGVWGPTLSHLPLPVREAWTWMFASALLAVLAGTVSAGALARCLLVRSLRRGATPRPKSEARTPWPLAQRRIPARLRRRWLRGNPIRWLMRYREDVRRHRWGAAVVISTAQLWMLLRPPAPGAWLLLESGLAVSISTFMALAAAGSFRLVREEGSWEMLWLTALRPIDFLIGRTMGLWWQFGPSWAAWVTGLFLSMPRHAPDAEVLALAAWGISMALSLPAMGLEASFHFRTFGRAALATLGGGVAASALVLWVGYMERSPGGMGALAALIPLGLALLCAPGFDLRLRQRRSGASMRGPSIPIRRSRPVATLGCREPREHR